jgi:hypothetical protein
LFVPGLQPAMELPKEEKSAASPSKGIDFKKVTAPRLFEGSDLSPHPAHARTHAPLSRARMNARQTLSGVIFLLGRLVYRMKI